MPAQKTPAPESPFEEEFQKVARSHPVLSLVLAKGGSSTSAPLRAFVEDQVTTIDGNLSYRMSEFVRDYVHHRIMNYLRLQRERRGREQYKWKMKDSMDALSWLAYMHQVHDTPLTHATLLKAFGETKMTERNALNESPANGLDLSFRSFGLLSRCKDGSYVFKEDVIEEYLVARYHAFDCLKKYSNKKKEKDVVTAAMKESLKKLPDTADIWRMTFGLIHEVKLQKVQKLVLKEMVIEAKKIGGPTITQSDMTSLCVESIFESQNAEKLTEYLDEFTMNQTINYSSIVLSQSRVPYTLNAAGYLVRTSQNVYGLHLANFGLTDNSIGMLADPLNAISDNNLQVLNLSYNTLGTKGMQRLQRFVVKASLLTHVDLSHCQLGDRGVTLFSEFFMCLPLRFLRLSENKITDKGLKRMVPNLKYIPTVEWLDLSGNQLTDESIRLLGQKMYCLPLLRNLDLQRNQIGDEGAEAISHSLDRMNTMAYLLLSENRIGSMGASSLAGRCWRTRSLRHLNLSLNHIPTNGILSLRRAANDHGLLEIQVDRQNVLDDEMDGSLCTDASSSLYGQTMELPSDSSLHLYSSMDLVTGDETLPSSRNSSLKRQSSHGSLPFQRAVDKRQSWHGKPSNARNSFNRGLAHLRSSLRDARRSSSRSSLRSRDRDSESVGSSQSTTPVRMRRRSGSSNRDRSVDSDSNASPATERGRPRHKDKTTAGDTTPNFFRRSISNIRDSFREMGAQRRSKSSTRAGEKPAKKAVSHGTNTPPTVHRSMPSLDKPGVDADDDTLMKELEKYSEEPKRRVPAQRKPVQEKKQEIIKPQKQQQLQAPVLKRGGSSESSKSSLSKSLSALRDSFRESNKPKEKTEPAPAPVVLRPKKPTRPVSQPMSRSKEAQKMSPTENAPPPRVAPGQAPVPAQMPIEASSVQYKVIRKVSPQTMPKPIPQNEPMERRPVAPSTKDEEQEPEVHLPHETSNFQRGTNDKTRGSFGRGLAGLRDSFRELTSTKKESTSQKPAKVKGPAIQKEKLRVKLEKENQPVLKNKTAPAVDINQVSKPAKIDLSKKTEKPVKVPKSEKVSTPEDTIPSTSKAQTLPRDAQNFSRSTTATSGGKKSFSQSLRDIRDSFRESKPKQDDMATTVSEKPVKVNKVSQDSKLQNAKPEYKELKNIYQPNKIKSVDKGQTKVTPNIPESNKRPEKQILPTNSNFIRSSKESSSGRKSFSQSLKDLRDSFKEPKSKQQESQKDTSVQKINNYKENDRLKRVDDNHVPNYEAVREPKDLNLPNKSSKGKVSSKSKEPEKLVNKIEYIPKSKTLPPPSHDMDQGSNAGSSGKKSLSQSLKDLRDSFREGRSKEPEQTQLTKAPEVKQRPEKPSKVVKPVSTTRVAKVPNKQDIDDQHEEKEQFQKAHPKNISKQPQKKLENRELDYISQSKTLPTDTSNFKRGRKATSSGRKSLSQSLKDLRDSFRETKSKEPEHTKADDVVKRQPEPKKKKVPTATLR